MKSKRLLINTDSNYEFIADYGWKKAPVMKYELIEETNYTLERIIVGTKVSLKLYITDPTVSISETILESMECRFQLSKWIHTCDYSEDGDTNTNTNGTVAYNHLIEDGTAESFGLAAYLPGQYNVLDWGFGLHTSGDGGASPTGYNTSYYLPDLSSAGITMTFTPNVNNESDDRLVILIEGNLV